MVWGSPVNYPDAKGHVQRCLRSTTTAPSPPHYIIPCPYRRANRATPKPFNLKVSVIMVFLTFVELENDLS